MELQQIAILSLVDMRQPCVPKDEGMPFPRIKELPTCEPLVLLLSVLRLR